MSPKKVLGLSYPWKNFLARYVQEIYQVEHNRNWEY